MNYTEKELKEAAPRALDSLRAILNEARYVRPEDWSREELENAAKLAGYSIAMKFILDIADRNRKKNEEVFTRDDLKGFISRRWGFRGEALDAEVEVSVKDMLDHREPEYPPRTVVRDNDGKGMHYMLTSERKWLMFGTAKEYSYDFPRRPLTVKS